MKVSYPFLIDSQIIKNAEAIINEANEKDTVDLSNLKLGELPVSLKQKNHIKKLMVDGNELTNLPEWIGDFKNLELINFSQNKISNLPDGFKKLNNLKTINANDNKIESLDCISNLENVNYIDISDNKLSSLDGVEKIKSLVYLNAANNLLYNIPFDINALEKLIYLDLTCNKFTHRPKILEEMPGCEVCMDDDEFESEFTEDSEVICNLNSQSIALDKNEVVENWLNLIS